MKLFLNIMLQTLSSIKLLGQTWVNCSCQQQCSTAGWFSSFLLFEEHNRIGSDQAIYWSSNLLDELFNLVAFINLSDLVYPLCKLLLASFLETISDDKIVIRV